MRVCSSVAGLLFAMLATAGGAAALIRHEARPPADATGRLEIPGPTTALGYVSSSACVPCHPGEHASFGRTFHRTMTARAASSAVIAPFDGTHLEAEKGRGDAVWARFPDGMRRVVVTTGSHREQAYWVLGERPGELRIAPFVWMTHDRAFVSREAAFLTPPGAPLPAVRWGSSCIACHAVAGEPRRDLTHDTWGSRVAELGVACEACHGPGAAHVERYRDPVARYADRGRPGDKGIVDPAKLPPDRAAAVCGQCHAYAFPRDEAGWWAEGYSRTFRAGDLLEPSRMLLDPGFASRPNAPEIDAPADALFWPDGDVRVGGREYHGLVGSACFRLGTGERKLTCTSCHAMHSGDPAGQIDPAQAGDRMCERCHSREIDRSHGRHRTVSCVGCHMPKTSYALLQAVRSHRIGIPSAAETVATARPNACNLCHLDRSLGWTASTLTAWYGARPLAVESERLVKTPIGLLMGIAGDAGVRALVADALGDAAPAFAAPVLRAMAADPYAAVRFIAARSLRKIGDRGNELDPELVRSLVAIRDERPVTIAE